MNESPTEPEPAKPHPTRSGVLTALATAVVVLLATGLLGWVQYELDGLYDSDSYFHTRAASELDRLGIQRTFPQASFSTWKERYSDKDFLFHVALIPFQRLAGVDPASLADSETLVRAGKQAAVFFVGLLFTCLAVALRLVRARFVPLWVLLLLCSQSGFLSHVLAVRPHLLGYAFIALEVALIQRRSVWPLALLGAVHTWTHSSFFLVPALAVVAAGAYALRDERVPWRSLLAAVLGPATTLVVHPYFPNNLSIAWEQLVVVARSAWGLESSIPADLFGPELSPASTLKFLVTFPVWGPAALGLLAFVLRPARSLSTPGLALTLMCGLLLVFSLLSQRFLGFFFPAAVVLGAHLWTELLDGRPVGALWRESRLRTGVALAALLACVVVGFARGHVGKVRELVLDAPRLVRQRAAVRFLEEHAAPEDLVYHSFWFEFSMLYHYRPEGRYVVALDPAFFYRRDSELFRKALRAHRGKLENLHQVLVEDFGARWVYLRRKAEYLGLATLIQADPRFALAFENGHVQIYRVTR